MFATVFNAEPTGNVVEKQEEFDIAELTEELLAIVGGGEGIVVM